MCTSASAGSLGPRRADAASVSGCVSAKHAAKRTGGHTAPARLGTSRRTWSSASAGSLGCVRSAWIGSDGSGRRSCPAQSRRFFEHGGEASALWIRCSNRVARRLLVAASRSLCWEHSSPEISASSKGVWTFPFIDWNPPEPSGKSSCLPATFSAAVSIAVWDPCPSPLVPTDGFSACWLHGWLPQMGPHHISLIRCTVTHDTELRIYRKPTWMVPGAPLLAIVFVIAGGWGCPEWHLSRFLHRSKFGWIINQWCSERMIRSL